jgi:hypothetical protein
MDIKEFVTGIIRNATAPTIMKREPISNRFNIKTCIVITDASEDEINNRYYIKEVRKLYFWNDIEGFKNANEKFIIAGKGIPEMEITDTQISKHISSIAQPEYFATISDRIIYKNNNDDIVVAKVVGFISNNSTSHYYYDVV